MDEKVTVRKAIEGDRGSFCELYDRYKVRLYRYSWYRLRNRQDAEDAVSDSVLSAWQQIGNLEKPEAFAAWIFTILRRTCAGYIKEQIRAKDTLPEEALESVTEAGEHDPGTSAYLMEALGSIPEDTGEMVLLSVVGGLTSKEIGEIYDMPQGTVRSRLSRAFADMRKMLEDGNEQ